MATVNFIRNTKQSGSAMGATIRYVERDDKTMNGRYVSGQNCTPQLAEQEFLATRAVNRKDGGRWFYHYTQSFSPQENVTPELAHEIAKEFAAQAWPESEVVIATHVDAAHIHSHFVVNAVCFETGKMLRQHPDTLRKLREISDKLCMAHGLSVLPRQQNKANGISAREYRSAVKGESWKFQLMAAVDDCMRLARSREEFIERMERAGYGVRWEDTRANITYTTPSGMKCRDKRLHEDKYRKENMEDEFRIRREIVCGRAEGQEPNADRFAAAHRGVYGTDRAAGTPARGAAQDKRVAVHALDEGGRSKVASDAEPNARSVATETGWERERETFLRQVAEGRGLAVDTSPETLAGMADRDPAGRNSMAAMATGEPFRGAGRAGVAVSAALQLAYGVEKALIASPVHDATTQPQHIDRKRRRELRDKRIALGHREDDHEDELNNKYQYQQYM